jgi:DEAD/DEAH box helicase domain-containing protein
LAEAGLLPMFGMPTRVRNLYLGSVLDDEDETQRSWSTIDRDLDLAIFEFAPGAVIVKDKQQHRCIGFTGPLENPFRPGSSQHPRDLVPYVNPFGEPFWLLHCGNCGSWHRYDQKPTGVDCRSCHYVLPDDIAGECRTPNGFRTDFYPRLIEDDDSVGRSHRSITAEYQHLSLTKTGNNLSYEYKSQIRTYRLNRGPDAGSPVSGASATGFNVDTYAHPLPGFRNTRLLQQMIDTANLPPSGSQPDASHPPLRNLWLAAPKTTDALFVAATRVPTGLCIDRVSGTSQLPAVRAAALSAAFILVQRAALELDIDPEEFDIVDPRTHILDGANVPVLQITDHLINGSGFCERLESIDATGQAHLVSIIRSIVTDPTAFPLKEFRRKERDFDHAAQCDQACYLCLQRYGNQSYHGLLDWRLGLSFLEALNDPNFRCGLDGNFESPSLSDWLTNARRYATELATRYRSDGEVLDIGKLVAFRLDRSRDQWAVVVHPLWDIHNPSGILQEAIDLLGTPPEFTDTFNLARRQVSERERLVQQWSR